MTFSPLQFKLMLFWNPGPVAHRPLVFIWTELNLHFIRILHSKYNHRNGCFSEPTYDFIPPSHQKKPYQSDNDNKRTTQYMNPATVPNKRSKNIPGNVPKLEFKIFLYLIFFCHTKGHIPGKWQNTNKQAMTVPHCTVVPNLHCSLCFLITLLLKHFLLLDKKQFTP